jgi:hypothetical protein
MQILQTQKWAIPAMIHNPAMEYQKILGRYRYNLDASFNLIV